MSETRIKTIEPHHLGDEDRELVDLATAALVDPNLHTDVRLRLHGEITEVLRAVRDDARARVGRAGHVHAPQPHDEPLPDLLAAVLVDPNVHTDLRLRLHGEIRDMLRATRAGGGR
jgi:hypothetical protein